MNNINNCYIGFELAKLDNVNKAYLVEDNESGQLTFQAYLDYLNDVNASTYDNRMWVNLHRLSLGKSKIVFQNNQKIFSISPVFPISFFFRFAHGIKKFFLKKTDSDGYKYSDLSIDADEFFTNNVYDYEIKIGLKDDIYGTRIFENGRVFFTQDEEVVLTFSLRKFTEMFLESYRICYEETLLSYIFFKDFTINSEIKQSISDIQWIVDMIKEDK